MITKHICLNCFLVKTIYLEWCYTLTVERQFFARSKTGRPEWTTIVSQVNILYFQYKMHNNLVMSLEIKQTLTARKFQLQRLVLCLRSWFDYFYFFSENFTMPKKCIFLFLLSAQILVTINKQPSDVFFSIKKLMLLNVD